MVRLRPSVDMLGPGGASCTSTGSLLMVSQVEILKHCQKYLTRASGARILRRPHGPSIPYYNLKIMYWRSPSQAATSLHG